MQIYQGYLKTSCGVCKPYLDPNSLTAKYCWYFKLFGCDIVYVPVITVTPIELVCVTYTNTSLKHHNQPSIILTCSCFDHQLVCGEVCLLFLFNGVCVCMLFTFGCKLYLTFLTAVVHCNCLCLRFLFNFCNLYKKKYVKCSCMYFLQGYIQHVQFSQTKFSLPSILQKCYYTYCLKSVFIFQKN